MKFRKCKDVFALVECKSEPVCRRWLFLDVRFLSKIERFDGRCKNRTLERRISILVEKEFDLFENWECLLLIQSVEFKSRFFEIFVIRHDIKLENKGARRRQDRRRDQRRRSRGRRDRRRDQRRRSRGRRKGRRRRSRGRN